MFKVKCFLPNASDNINGIAFMPCPDGGVESVDALPDEEAKQFDGIRGYALIPVVEAPKPVKPKRNKS